jgi:16S rRNA (uracil1498-N3)-methyltransferase
MAQHGRSTADDADHRKSAPRLFVDGALSAGCTITFDGPQANYLLNVLRLREGAAVLLFNGRDGEWRATIDTVRKRSCDVAVMTCERVQTEGPDVDYLFAPLKHARLDYMVQKAAEMGVRRLRPVITRRTNAERVNLERMRANAIEAAEQCGILHVSQVEAPVKLESVLA